MSGAVQGHPTETQQQVERWAVTVRGIVQGVGFRPFIYALARRHGVTGAVRNDAQGVLVEAEGHPDHLEHFLRGIREDAPPLALVETVSWQPVEVRGDAEFRIEESQALGSRLALISPDVATCDACLAELFDPADRRYRYPFINCTNCGPRFTITRSVPYDRAATTMAGFEMCPACRREYHDPADRRFHAQPNACPVCGPQVRLVDRHRQDLDPAASPGTDDPIARAAGLLRRGAILAVKGLGGYHLACDPFNPEAVAALRSRKGRQEKPFALMARSPEDATALCRAAPHELRWLTAATRPIVLLRRRDDIHPELFRDEGVAPRQKTLGIMLPYTPLHHLLLHDMGSPLVMTSGNRTDEPIAYRDEEAFEQLGDIADYFLIHDRPVHMRCDDSVVRVTTRGLYPLRRSRGFAPVPLTRTPGFSRHVLACGGELKNTFCLAKEGHAFLSHHIGDLENYQTLRSFREGVEHYCRLFDIQPALVAYDLHPEYLSTKYALELEEEGLPAVGVQHHHAHVASCLADNGRPVEERVIGVAMDGTGYGTDGAIWGGEFLEGSVQEGFTRRAHLAYTPLPGGQASIRQPWLAALAHLLTLYREDELLELPLEMVRQAGRHKVRLVAQLLQLGHDAPWVTPRTSSAGRLFDAVAALCALPGTRRTTYEGQAAVELEMAAGAPAVSGYPVGVRDEGELWTVDTREIIASVAAGLLSGRSVAEVSSAFHRTVADLVLACCLRIRERTGVGAVALSGGTFQNMLLLEQTTALLEDNGFSVYRHQRVPANDGGLALGQAVLADSLYNHGGGARPPEARGVDLVNGTLSGGKAGST